ncbi:acyltransferase [Dokdonia sp. 4H-3-7-5]|uniref:acyltransferase n=1 Tax=Dokdonia sp. (strain 4H-3-7-5) TaxID=983548 RepID=UPI00020A6DE0|nr:acyltransferase [Dokdonia sp. 4H-3-7-5]AEE20746.1 hypothetical protein Krodi_2771 [Dokdonia sp. 4H-3-7-5]
MSILKKIYKYIYINISAKLNHERYARNIGVNAGENLHIYGNPIGMFGTEPWCIKLGNDVHITREVVFITHDGGTLLFRDKFPDLEITSPITVGNKVYIGVRSIILPGVTIGNNCIIGAGSVVTKNVEDNSVVAGVPARYIKSTDDYLKKIQQNSLKIGHLVGKEKDDELKKIFNYQKTKS